MKNSKPILAIIILSLAVSVVFGQSPKSISLSDCLDEAVKTHPLQPGKKLLTDLAKVQNEIQDKSDLPSISWQAQARIQSENISLNFDAPNIPSIDIPLYSAQTSLEINYNLYDGGISKANQKYNEQNTLVSTK